MSTPDPLIPLTDDERQVLIAHRTGMLKILVGYCIVAVAALLVLVFFHPFYMVLSMLGVSLGLLILTVMALPRLRKFSSDLGAGQKTVISGPVEAQDIDVSRETDRGGAEGDASYRYWIQVKGKKITVTEDQYYQFKKGDIVEALVAPYSQTIFSINKESLNRPFH